jgi:hypothetical protein
MILTSYCSDETINLGVTENSPSAPLDKRDAAQLVAGSRALVAEALRHYRMPIQTRHQQYIGGANQVTKQMFNFWGFAVSALQGSDEVGLG